LILGLICQITVQLVALLSCDAKVVEQHAEMYGDGVFPCKTLPKIIWTSHNSLLYRNATDIALSAVHIPNCYDCNGKIVNTDCSWKLLVVL
jgi:hypothetical protein